MKWAVIALTKGGLKQAYNVREKLSIQEINLDIYTLPKWNDDEINIIDGSLEEFVGGIFNKYDILLFIMATGIVVRVIAKHLVHKSKDPGVLVMDEKGEFVISLLSGHLGGANDMTHLLARSIGATPVITTASDVKEAIAVDTLAMKLGCEIESFEEAKNITALIVNDERVVIASEINIKLPLPYNIIKVEETDLEEVKGIIYVNNKRTINSKKPKVQLIPKNIIIGLGCKRNIPGEKIISDIKDTLEELNIHIKSIKHMATVDLKKDEAGIIEAAEYYNTPLRIISREDIRQVEGEFSSSAFVKKAIGVGGVCEPCGYIGSNYGKCIMGKKASQGVTISVWEEKYNE